MSLFSQPSIAIDLEASSSPPIYICDNTEYEGASLPLPPKKKSQAVISTEDTPAESAVRKNLHKRESQSFFGTGPLDLTALNLTEEQKQKIAQMRSENGNKMRELMRKRRELSLQMKDIMFGAEATEAQIRSKRDEVRQVQEKLEDLRLTDFLSIRALLTLDQKQKLKDVRVASDFHRERDSRIGQQAKNSELSEQKKIADSPIK